MSGEQVHPKQVLGGRAHDDGLAVEAHVKDHDRCFRRERTYAGATTDAMEARPLEFHRRVRNMFLELPSYYPRPVMIVDASADEDEVFARILEALTSVID